MTFSENINQIFIFTQREHEYSNPKSDQIGYSSPIGALIQLSDLWSLILSNISS